jgi:hypothetical protein
VVGYWGGRWRDLWWKDQWGDSVLYRKGRCIALYRVGN